MATSGGSFPEYIDFLLSPDTPLDFHINVGDASTSKRFGVVKWMLVARSKVLRRMMHQSKLKHEKEFPIPDLDPLIFEHFLVYIYGHDNTESLSFEDSVSLLTAAEKYDVLDLKTKLGNVITPKTTAENVFTVLGNAPVCETVTQLWEKVTMIIQEETEDLFSSPQFLRASKESVLYIVQQDSLSVPEIDVWKAALNWARYQGQPMEIVSPQSLRKTLLPMLKHIRVCSLSYDQLIEEVFPTEVLTIKEIRDVCSTVAKNEKSPGLVEICSEINERSKGLFESFEADEEIHPSCNSKTSSVRIETKGRDVKLCSVEFQANKAPSSAAPDSSYQEKCKIQISCRSNSWEPPVEIISEKQVKYDERFLVRLTNVRLKANSSYYIMFTLSVGNRQFYTTGFGSNQWYYHFNSFSIYLISRSNSPVSNLRVLKCKVF